jgi:cytoskeletal protein CcmA (bactofilin family)
VKNNLIIKPTALFFALSLVLVLVFPAVSQEVSPEGRETPGKEAETLETAPSETGGETEASTETGALEGEENEEKEPFEIEANEGDVVKIGQDLYVAEGEVVPGDAVCIDGDLTIAGTVHGDAVCASGDIVLESTAVVNGDVVSIGGCIDKASGAEVGGQEVCIGGKFAPIIPIITPLITKLGEISEPIAETVIDITWEIVFFLFLMFLGLLLSVFMKRQMDNVHDHLTKEFPRSALLGIALVVLAPIEALVIVLIGITCIGLPLAILILVALFALHYIGYVVFGEVIGSFILGSGKHPMLKILVGVAILQSVAIIGDVIAIPAGIFGDIGGVFGFVGTIIFLTCGVLGAGSIIYSRLGLWDLEKTREWHVARANNKKEKAAIGD